MSSWAKIHLCCKKSILTQTHMHAWAVARKPCTCTHTQTYNHKHLLTILVIVGPSISYYLFLWLPIDHACSGCTCAGYDVLYYLCVSVSLSVRPGWWDWVCTLGSVGGRWADYGWRGCSLISGNVKCLWYRWTPYGTWSMLWLPA